MMMFETQNYAVADGINYEYVYLKAKDDSKGTFLFLHGFPSSFYCWRHQIKFFSEQGYGCLAPNLMGYGQTYSPADYNAFRKKSMVEHLIALLDHLNLNQVIVVAHDWGVSVAARFVLYHPERSTALVLLNIGYNRPAQLNYEQMLQVTKKIFGYETLGYWEFFTSPDAAKIIEDNADRFLDIGYAEDPTLWKTDFAPLGRIRHWLTTREKSSNRASYITEEDYRIMREQITDKMQTKLNWYRSVMNNIDWDDEKNLDPTLKCPVLYIGGLKDYICIPKFFADQKKFIADLETTELETSHWTMEEKPDDVNKIIKDYIERKTNPPISFH